MDANPPARPGARKELHKRAHYAHPPEVVWSALTDPAALAQWLMPNNFEPVLGKRFEFRVDPALFYSGIVQCEVLELDPPRRMVWSWRTLARPGKRQAPAMRIAWSLIAEGAGTRLELRQSGLEGQPFLHGLMMSMGWSTMLERWLPKVLAAFERSSSGLVYQRLERAPNRGHHRTRTIPPEFQR